MKTFYPKNQPSIPGDIEKMSKKLQSKHKMVVKPNTKMYVSGQIDLAIQKGVISPDDKKTAAAALFTAGKIGAEKYGKNTIQIRDIQKTWDSIKMGPGNCPPHECLFSTVISRKEDFGSKFPDFEELM